MYAIRRHRAAVNAWCWRVNFRRRGKLYSNHVYDIACGGSEKALAKAIAWRDRRLKEAKVLTVTEFHKQRRTNNTSGVPGVHFHKTPPQPRGFWQATIRFRDGKRMAKSFSIRKLGRRAAFARAVLLQPEPRCWRCSRTARTSTTTWRSVSLRGGSRSSRRNQA